VLPSLYTLNQKFVLVLQEDIGGADHSGRAPAGRGGAAGGPGTPPGHGLSLDQPDAVRFYNSSEFVYQKLTAGAGSKLYGMCIFPREKYYKFADFLVFTSFHVPAPPFGF
jgi:hypothetical protein